MTDSPIKSKASEESSTPTTSVLTRTLRIIAWPLSGLIGWWWMHKEARDSLYDTVKHSKSFEAVRKKRHWKNINAIVEETLTNKTDVIAPLAREHAVFGAETTKFFRDLGVHHTLDYLRGIHRNEAMKAIMTGGGAASVSLGVILTLAENDRLKKLLSEKEEKNGGSVTL